MDTAKELLEANRTAVEKIVEELLVKNHLSSSEIDKIFSQYATKQD